MNVYGGLSLKWWTQPMSNELKSGRRRNEQTAIRGRIQTRGAGDGGERGEKHLRTGALDPAGGERRAAWCVVETYWGASFTTTTATLRRRKQDVREVFLSNGHRTVPFGIQATLPCLGVCRYLHLGCAKGGMRPRRVCFGSMRSKNGGGLPAMPRGDRTFSVLRRLQEQLFFPTIAAKSWLSVSHKVDNQLVLHRKLPRK
jgi:hypothetical protein